MSGHEGVLILRFSGIESDSLEKGRGGSGLIALLEMNLADFEEGVGLLWIDLGDFFKRDEGFGGLAFGGEEDAGDVQEVGLVGLDGESAVNGGTSFGDLVHGEEDFRLLRIGESVLRVFLKGLLK